MAKNQRLYPRLECLASVRLQKGGESLSFGTRNISLGGALLECKESQLKLLPVGSMVDVVLFDPMDETATPVKTPARVVRHDPAGIALAWAGEDADTAFDLATLLENLKPKR